jgi:hypothetical protein
MTLSLNSGEKLLIVKIILLLICSVVEIGMCPPFGKGCYGQLNPQRWDIDGSQGMWKELGFGKIFGLVLVALLSNIEIFIPLLMNKTLL